jgi:phosphate transport system permease protein
MKISKRRQRTKFIAAIIARIIMYLSLAAVFAFAIAIIWVVIRRGWNCVTWEMVSSLPGDGFYVGKSGGFLNAIVGSVYIVGASTILGLLISIPAVFYMNVYLKKRSRFANIARLAYDVLFGIPSIVYGAFAFTLMIEMGMRTSLLGGLITVTLLIIPILIRSMDEVAKNIPHDLYEASYALGSTRFETIGLVMRQILPGIATATLLSIGRALGDAAGVMFTAGFSDSIPTSLTQQTATLPLSIFFQLSAPQVEVQERAYAGAFVLTVIVLVISVLGRIITNKFSKNKI